MEVDVLEPTRLVGAHQPGQELVAEASDQAFPLAKPG